VDAESDPYRVLGVDRLASDQEIERAWKRRRNRLQPRSERGEREAESELQRVNAARLMISEARGRERAEAEAAAKMSTTAPVAAPASARPPSPRRPHGVPRAGPAARPASCSLRPEPRRAPATEGVVVKATRVAAPAPWQDPLSRRDVHAELSFPWLLAFHGGTCALELDFGERGVEPVEFDVPPCCAPGHRWRLKGKGVREGDLWIVAKEVRPHPFFRVDPGGNVHMQLRVAYADLYCGTEITIPGPWGDVPVGLLPGRREPLRLLGHGRRGGSQRPGDLVVTLDVVYPDPGDAALGEVLGRLQRGVMPEPVRLR
jgi:DnaJ-class molecular chaperone